jgi:ABC-type glycerol-3-phosphate transport system substrate-binding protein
MKTKFFAFCVMLVMTFALAACGDDAADTLLADVEKVVVSIETLAKKDAVSADEFQAATKEFEAFGTKYSGANVPKFNDAQTKRMQDLTTRLMTAYQSLAGKIR